MSTAPPSAINPLGAPWPGQTYNEDDKPNWVGHLITKYCPQPRYVPKGYKEDASKDKPALPSPDISFKQNPILVYNYATGGHTVLALKDQIERQFLLGFGKQQKDEPGSAKKTLLSSMLELAFICTSLI